jgi:TPR repeat protein
VVRQERFTLSAAVTIMTILAIMVGVYVNQREVGHGLIWLGERMTGTAGRDTMPAVESNADSRKPASEAVKKVEPTKHERPETHLSENAPAATPQAPTKSSAPSVSPLSEAVPAAGAGTEPGQVEYSEAMNLIRGNAGEAGSQEALRLLWISVEKGNPGAEVVLADKYWHGDGVTKNCDQTRILLTAAARKGSAEGKKQLQQFDKEGCE